jgi:hypothetical protein
MKLQPRVDRLTLQRKYSEYALVYSTKRFPLYEPLKSLYPHSELTKGK